MNINDHTTANLLMRQGTCQHRLSVQTAKESQLIRAQNRDLRHRRRRQILNLCLDAALTAGITIGVLATIGLLAIVIS